MIHPTAIVSSNAKIGQNVSIGPYSVIEGEVTIGKESKIGPYCHFVGNTKIGDKNRFHAGCVVGDDPQDLKYQSDLTKLVIGDSNVFREHVTIHRSNTPNEDTSIGSHNFFMANCHIGHNSKLGDHNTLVNGALLAGHTVIEDHVFISGNCMVHQFVRIGAYAFMQGGSGISLNLPPYTLARGTNQICGLNIVGLRRAGFSRADLIELKRLYHLLFRNPENLQTRLQKARQDFNSNSSCALIEFVTNSNRGTCHDINTKSIGGD